MKIQTHMICSAFADFNKVLCLAESCRCVKMISHWKMKSQVDYTVGGLNDGSSKCVHMGPLQRDDSEEINSNIYSQF